MLFCILRYLQNYVKILFIQQTNIQLRIVMKTNVLFIIYIISITQITFAQNTIVRGSVFDSQSGNPIADVLITIEENGQSVKTDLNGEFQFPNTIPLGEQVLKVEKKYYTTKRYPIVINAGKTLDISGMTLTYNLSDSNKAFIISISDENLNNDDDGITDNISGLLQASRDVFLTASAFDFSATFFKPRGLDNTYGNVLINGIIMNKQFNGRPQWANWGGINDLQRHQEFTMGMGANDYTFGNLAGTNAIILRASAYRKGGRVSYASANRSYTGRIMGSYKSGLIKGGWSYATLMSRRYGNKGFVDGTLYDSNSFVILAEKKINDSHSINFTGIYAKNRRGRSTAITNEIYTLKGTTYNPFWGTQHGTTRNSRTRKINEPMVMLNHFWTISSTVKLNTNIAYQFGEVANSRIDNNGSRLDAINNGQYGGARNPTPEYYQNLPSFFLQDNNPTAYDYQLAFIAQQNFITNGQLDWATLYKANTINNYAVYVLQSDVKQNKQLSINTIIDASLSNNIKLNGTIDYKILHSENFARIEDLLNGSGYLDIDAFAEQQAEQQTEGQAQSDLKNPNRIVVEGDRYKYNYKISSNTLGGFVQAQFKYNTTEFYTGITISQTTYQRHGRYENGFFPGNKTVSLLGDVSSFGNSKRLTFFNYGIKAGLTYKITGKHVIDINSNYFTKAPSIRNSFSNVRQSNQTVLGLDNETIQSIDIGYIYRAPNLKLRLTSFYSSVRNGTNIGFFFTENSNNFVQEIQTNIEKRRFGIELGADIKVTATINLKAVAAVGQYTFSNNPNVYYLAADFKNSKGHKTMLTYGDGTTALQNLHLANGPQRAYQLGFQYRDPEFWTIGMTSNFFSNAYINPSALKRSASFNQDIDLLPVDSNNNLIIPENGNISGYTINDYDDTIAKELLQQEQFESYMIVNVIGGKSWRIGNYYLGFFATVNNVFNQKYKTGGFEQSRRVDYNSQIKEQTNPNGPLFGNRYFFGNGTTYYLNAYINF